MSSLALAGPLSASQTDRVILLCAALAALGAAAVVLRGRPRLCAVVYLVVLCFVPVWLGVNLIAYFMPVTLVGIFVLLLIIPVRNVKFGLADLTVLFFMLACLTPLLTGGATLTTVFVTFTEFALPFTLGRLLALKAGGAWIARCIAVVFTAVSILAIVEFTLSWNPFVAVPASNGLFEAWGPLQERGGVTRAEGAFGHSIALGVSVAMAIPFTLASDLKLHWKLLMTGAMLACTVVTFSRLAMICAALALALSVLFLQDGLAPRVRAAAIAVLAVLASVLIPIVTSTFSAAGDEATNSASYRGDLTSLIPTISVVGFSSSAQRTPAGDLFFGRFRSIDSALVLLGLTYGWLALVFAVALLGGAMVKVVARQAMPATIAVVAVIPALASVALITQFGTWVWFVAGLAVAAQLQRRVSTSGSEAPSSPAVPDRSRSA